MYYHKCKQQIQSHTNKITTIWSSSRFDTSHMALPYVSPLFQIPPVSISMSVDT